MRFTHSAVQSVQRSVLVSMIIIEISERGYQCQDDGTISRKNVVCSPKSHFRNSIRCYKFKMSHFSNEKTHPSCMRFTHAPVQSVLQKVIFSTEIIEMSERG